VLAADVIARVEVCCNGNANGREILDKGIDRRRVEVGVAKDTRTGSVAIQGSIVCPVRGGILGRWEFPSLNRVRYTMSSVAM
jgi:hypothetical protein